MATLLIVFFIRHYFSFFFCASLHHRNVQQIIEHKIDLKVESKVGSLANIKHKPGGGDKKVFNDVEYLRQTSSTLQSGNVSRTSSRRESATQVTPLWPLNKIDKFARQYCSTNIYSCCAYLHLIPFDYSSQTRL